MEDGEDASEASFGSVISLQSLEDSSSIQEKPKNAKRKTRTDHSPYSTPRYSGSIPGRNSGKATGHEAWSAAIRNGYTGLSSESTPSNQWAHPRVKTKKTKLSGGPFSRDEHTLSSGKPAYKSPEDYYDEIMELRRVMKELKSDNGVLKTKLQRITQENVLKDRQIKDFLNPNKQPDEIRRTLTDRKADSSAVISSLKQKLHAMERNVKDKENELRKLKSDLKTTNNEELKIQLETYYQETQRLQSVLSSVYSQAPGTRTLPDTRTSSRGSSRVNSPRRVGPGEIDHDRLEIIIDENRRLESENKGLKKDLLNALERPPKGDKTSRNKNIDYADMNRVQMLRKIGELEQLLQDAEDKAKSVLERENKESKSKKNEKETHESELQKQRLVIENLKQDRTHYREEAEKLRVELQDAHEEIEKLKEEVRKTNERNLSKATSPPSRPTPRQRTKTGSLKKSISFQTVDKMQASREKDEEKAARTLQRQWRQYNKKKATDQDKELSMAVVQLQSILRGHATRRQRVNQPGHHPEDDEDLDWDDAITRIQSALRGHQARRRYYPDPGRNAAPRKRRSHSTSDHSSYSSEDDKEQRRIPNLNQQLLNKSPEPNSPRRKTSTSRYLNQFVDHNKDAHDDDDDEDDDDDVVIGGSRHNLRDGKRTAVRTHAETAAPKSSFSNHESGFNSSRRRKEVSADNEDVQMRFGKSSKVSKSNKPKNGFSFLKSTANEPNENKLTFFGREREHAVDKCQKEIVISNDSSLDSIFSPSRPMKLPYNHRAGRGEDSDGDLVTSDKKPDQSIENKSKKSIFSWGGGSKSKKPENVSSLKSEKKASNKKDSTKSSNVWSSRPSEIVDDDDDDDVVVTPKITRRNQTKTASLLDELF